MSQPPRSLKEIKNDFLQVVKPVILKHFGIKLTKNMITIEDLKNIAEQSDSDWYFYDTFIDENNRLKQVELQDFVHNNISQFSFYKADIV